MTFEQTIEQAIEAISREREFAQSSNRPISCDCMNNIADQLARHEQAKHLVPSIRDHQRRASFPMELAKNIQTALEDITLFSKS